MEVIEHWVDEDGFLNIRAENGEIFRLNNVYPVDIKWEGLDYDSKDECQIISTQRYSNETYRRNC